MLKLEERDEIRSIIRIEKERDSDGGGGGLGYIIVCVVMLGGLIYLLSILWEKLHQFCWTFGLY